MRTTYSIEVVCDGKRVAHVTLIRETPLPILPPVGTTLVFDNVDDCATVMDTELNVMSLDTQVSATLHTKRLAEMTKEFQALGANVRHKA